VPARQLPDGIEAARVLDEPVQLVTGPAHELAAARAVTPAELAGHRIWMPSPGPPTTAYGASPYTTRRPSSHTR
jgi:DNA-binding transcriptional LysR family regulator